MNMLDKILTSKALIALFLSCFTANIFAANPMSENDLDNVSADAGQNIFNVFGLPAAGLKDENYVESSYQETDATEPVAEAEVRERERDSVATEAKIQESSVTEATAEEAISASLETVGLAKSFTTTSEIRYKTKDSHHDMTLLENGGVAVTRDLSIDLLKLENLRGAHFDESRSAGSIYISNWHSRGQTKINTNR